MEQLPGRIIRIKNQIIIDFYDDRENQILEYGESRMKFWKSYYENKPENESKNESEDKS